MARRRACRRPNNLQADDRRLTPIVRSSTPPRHDREPRDGCAKAASWWRPDISRDGAGRSQQTIRDRNGNPARTTADLLRFPFEYLLRGDVLLRELDGLRPPFRDQHRGVPGGQLERVTDMNLGQVHTVDAFREFTYQPHAKGYAVPHVMHFSTFINVDSSIHRFAVEHNLCEQVLPRATACHNEENNIRPVNGFTTWSAHRCVNQSSILTIPTRSERI